MYFITSHNPTIFINDTDLQSIVRCALPNKNTINLFTIRWKKKAEADDMASSSDVFQKFCQRSLHKSGSGSFVKGGLHKADTSRLEVVASPRKVVLCKDHS